MNRKIKFTSILMAVIIMFSLVTIGVSAADYREISSGNTGFISISNQTNVLYYKNPHGSFNLRIYVKASGMFLDTRYSISMYDNAGRCVFNAANQGDRTYYIGGNVTKIVTRTNASIGVTLYWQKK